MKIDESFQYTSERIKYKDKKIQTYSFGTGDKIIFSFPSFPHSGLYYLLFTRFYDHSKFKFVTFDIPGWAGWSDNTFESEPFSFDAVMDIADAVKKHYGIEKFSIIGYSFGGALAILYALRHLQEINSLVIVSAIVDGKLMDKERVKFWVKIAYRLGWASKVKSTMVKKYKGARMEIATAGIDPALLEQYDAMIKRTNSKILLEGIYSLFNLDIRDQLEKLKVVDKLLIINSAEEESFFRRQAEFLRRFFQTEASFKIHGSHNDFIARPRQEYIKKVIDFLIS